MVVVVVQLVSTVDQVLTDTVHRAVHLLVVCVCVIISLSLCRSFWRHVLLPSSHPPVGNGLVWAMAHERNGPLKEIAIL